MEPIFNEWDFHPQQMNGLEIDREIAKAVAKQANRKIEKLIKNWPVVYNSSSIYWDPNESPGLDTHRARLAFIEKIKECKHEPDKPVMWSDEKHAMLSHCRKCGAALIAEWKEQK